MYIQYTYKRHKNIVYNFGWYKLKIVFKLLKIITVVTLKKKNKNKFTLCSKLYLNSLITDHYRTKIELNKLFIYKYYYCNYTFAIFVGALLYCRITVKFCYTVLIIYCTITIFYLYCIKLLVQQIFATKI